jgi:hypothetical protein
MNLNKALEWLLENGVEKEPEEDAVDHKDEASSGAGHRQWQQEPACKMSRFLACLVIVLYCIVIEQYNHETAEDIIVIKFCLIS